MKRRYTLALVCVDLVLLSACDKNNMQGGIEGSGITTTPVVNVPPSVPIPPVGAAITTSGAVTALGSIVVNGVEYNLDFAALTIDGASASESELAPGQVAVVEGVLSGARAFALNVTVETYVAGRVSAIDVTLGQLTILGQTIAIDPGTIVEDRFDGSTLRKLDLGADVQVSGFADSSAVIHATRIAARRPSTPLLVTGRVAHLDTSARTFSVNGQPVSYARATLAASPTEGMSVRVTAKSLDRETLVAEELSPRDAGLPGEQGATATLQGWVTRLVSANDFEVDGRRVVLNEESNVVRLDAFVMIRGALGSRGIVVASEVNAVLPARLAGSVTIDDVEYGVSGLMTQEGAFRLNIEEWSGGPHAVNSGLGQLVGHFSFGGNSAVGTAVLIGEGCGLASAGRFCQTATPVRIELTKTGSSIDLGSSGVMRVATQNGESTWPVHLGYWGGRAGFDFESPAYTAGVYELHQAEFIAATPVHMNVDRDGRVFFQSAETGCIGNGTIAGDRYGVALKIESCNGPFSHLNADFEGLAIKESLAPWDYDYSVLSMWLSTPTGASAPAAVALWATYLQ